MGKDWRDNKYGHEAGYSALNESESLGFVFKVLGVLAVAVIAVLLLLGVL